MDWLTLPTCCFTGTLLYFSFQSSNDQPVQLLFHWNPSLLQPSEPCSEYPKKVKELMSSQPRCEWIELSAWRKIKVEKHQLMCQSLRLFKKAHSWTVFHETSDLSSESSAFVAQTVQKPLLCLETSIRWDWACCLSWHVWHRHDLRQRWGTQTHWKFSSGSAFTISAARAAPLAMESVSSSSALRSVVFRKGARS